MAEKKTKAPFKVLFSNDTTNITSCLSPYHAKGDPLTDDAIRATVDEATGADVHLLQPGCGWIPWWKSKVYPAKEHYRWHREDNGLTAPNAFEDYMNADGDLIKPFIEQCRKNNVTPFISYRLNDGHGLEYAGTDHRYRKHTVSKFYEAHPEYRIGPNPKDWHQRVHNWAIPEVRDHKFAFIEEICENYDIGGLELDFMRHVSYFQLDKTTSEQRKQIMTEYVSRIRQLLNRTSRPDQHRWLCVRVPAQLAAHDALGIDLPAMVRAGVDMVNLSCYYFTIQQTDLAKIRRQIPGTAIYLEMTHCTTTGPSRGGYDSFTFRRTTPHQFYTAAHMAYQEGADGVSLFNFVYYRQHGTEGRGPFNEPPFHVLEHLDEPQWLARQPQWYFLAKVPDAPKTGNRPLPKRLKTKESCTFALDLYPTDAHTKNGILRLMTEKDSGGRQWTVILNGQTLEPTSFVDKPIDHPYDPGRGNPEQYACFTCPRSAVLSGRNQLTVSLDQGNEAVITYVDLVLP